MRTSSARITPVTTKMTAKDFMAAMTTEVPVCLLTMDGSVLSRLLPSSSPAHWKNCDDEASGSRPDPDTNTSHRRLKMDHSSSVTPIFTFGSSSFGPLMTTAARGRPAACMCIVEWAANTAQVSLLWGRLVGAVGDGAFAGEH